MLTGPLDYDTYVGLVLNERLAVAVKAGPHVLATEATDGAGTPEWHIANAPDEATGMRRYWEAVLRERLKHAR